VALKNFNPAGNGGVLQKDYFCIDNLVITSLMILIADSGSTKTVWAIIDGKNAGTSFTSPGISPYFMTTDEIYSLLLNRFKNDPAILPESIYFYGTGCNSPVKKEVVKKALGNYFKTTDIIIESDMLGAARSLCGNKPGIACIIGTGSNSCYYDGKTIKSNVAPLGYILGDEGGAADLGKKLLSEVLKNQLPGEICSLFFDTYNITRAEILENTYMKPFPNRYLGQFAKFISSNIHMPELQSIVTSGFDEFIKHNLLQYHEATELASSFTGSIAYNFRTFLEECLCRNNLKLGKITPEPMEGLINYHIENR
jgi:N-acetylglucosamine kinase-like BadF-type ATPase